MSTSGHQLRGDSNVVETGSSTTTTTEGQRAVASPSNEDIARAAMEARKEWTVGGGVGDARPAPAPAAVRDGDATSADDLAARRGPPAPRAWVTTKATWLAAPPAGGIQPRPEPMWLR